MTVVTASSFSWMDHDDEEAGRVREALAAFDSQGMVDPLGFGVVRDAFSDALFPGVSTVQTRARYFLFVPWLYNRLDIERVPPARALERAKDLEVALITSLLEGSKTPEGIIGRRSRGDTKQLPSLIYWGGLQRWDIRRFHGTRAEYLATVARGRSQRDREDVDAEGAQTYWHPALPGEPAGLLESATLELTFEEADFLRGRVLSAATDTFLSTLVRDGSSEHSANLPWDHPLAKDSGVQSEIREVLDHAELFAMATHGAGLLYNAELSRRLEQDGRAPLKDDYPQLVKDWLGEMRRLRLRLGNWDRSRFWTLVARQRPIVPAAVQRFVDWWLDASTESPGRLPGSTEITEELRRRELAIKGSRAKLANRRARELFPSAQGQGIFSFRWTEASDITRDIQLGLESRAEPA